MGYVNNVLYLKTQFQFKNFLNINTNLTTLCRDYLDVAHPSAEKALMAAQRQKEKKEGKR